MNEQEIIEANLSIFKFMGAQGSDSFLRKNAPAYHKRWELLKPVIDKIFTYALVHREQVDPIRKMSIVVDIGAAFVKVVNFIQWYNKQQQPPEKKQPDLGICHECKHREAIKDYNGHGHFVCQPCYDSLNREFEKEYK